MLSKMLTIREKNIKFRILSYLYDNENNVTNIAKAIKSQKANVSRTINELRKSGLVRKEVIGRSHKYKLNLLNPSVRDLIEIIIKNRIDAFDKKLNCMPSFLNSYLNVILKNNYKGCIFFGSALTNKYKDIDVFIMAKNLKNKEEITKKIKSFNTKIAPLFGARKELEKGFINHDMLYLNIINGLPFSCLNFIINLKYKEYFLRRKDIEERFIIGYREIQSCKEFKDDKIYIKNHLKKGILDMVYSVLNYLEFTPKNDYEALKLFRKNFKLLISYKNIKKSENLAKKLWKVIFD